MNRFWKPWFVHQPAQLLRRAVVSVTATPQGYRALPTSWGGQIIADPRRTIGHSIRTTGLYDLAVSEALARLVSPGDTVVDAGANIGYMSVLAARLAGAGGEVLSFEPHPGLFGILQRNARGNGGRAVAPITCHPCALGERSGTARLQLPPDFESNDGVASVVETAAADATGFDITLATLDEMLPHHAGVLKLDVEGYEAQVLQGAAQALRERRIRHIVFEDHAVETSQAVELLRSHGYAVFALGWSMGGPLAQPLAAGRVAEQYEAPSYLATIAPDEALRRIAVRGWQVLRQLRAVSGS